MATDFGEITLVLINLGLLVAFFLLGFMTGRSERRLKNKKPDYVCQTCNHGFGYHSDKSGKCSRRNVLREGCTCQNYIGDKPPLSYEELTA